MYHLIYRSQAKTALTLSTLIVILMQSRSLNERRQITGALVYGDGQFMQVLEGEETVIKQLYQHIAHDARHHDVQLLAEGPIAARSFTRWSMAFGEVPAAEFELLRRVAAYQTPTELASQLPAGGERPELLQKMHELLQGYAKE